MTRTTTMLAMLLCSGALAACDDGVSDDEAARQVYLGLDNSVERALNLGFDGFNAASSANIPEQSENGALSGTILVNGQVDQGNSDNKEMRLDVSYLGYSDGVADEEEPLELVYDSDAPATLDLSLKGLPDADMDGTFVGDVRVGGDLEGIVTLDLTITGTTQQGEGDAIVRVPGSTHITGTAVSEHGTYVVDVTR